VTFKIATLSAWKVFSLLVLITSLMIILMPFNGLGFLIAALGMFGWLYSISYELCLKASQAPKRIKRITVMGLVSSILFILVPLIVFPKYVTALLVFGVGAAFMYSMLYLIFKSSRLLQSIDPTIKYSFILIWAWPVGVWFLQPKLQKLLSRNT